MMKLVYMSLIFVTCICFARGDPIESVECDEKGTLTATRNTGTQWSLPDQANCGNEKLTIAKNATTIVIEGCSTNTDVTFNSTHQFNEGSSGSVAFTAEDETVSVTLRCNAIHADTTKVAQIAVLDFSQFVKSYERFNMINTPQERKLYDKCDDFDGLSLFYCNIPASSTYAKQETSEYTHFDISCSGTHSVSQISKDATETINMVMELRTTKEPHIVTNKMTIHDTYTLLIAGAGSHDTNVTQCTAAGSVNASGTDIYPTSSPTVLTPFTSANTSTLKIKEKTVNQMSKLTGFRLVGSDKVFLKCTITVCANACPSPAPNNRKRKGGKHPTHTQYATLKLDVRDNLIDTSPNGAADTFPSGGKMMKFIVLVAIMNFLY